MLRVSHWFGLGEKLGSVLRVSHWFGLGEKLEVYRPASFLATRAANQFEIGETVGLSRARAGSLRHIAKGWGR